jgi:Peptidase S46
MKSSYWRRSSGALALLALAVGLTSAHADEGMWTFNNFPSDKVAKVYGFRPDQKWLDHVRLSSVRLADAEGCSASFVSAHGLIQTNHHCARNCIEQLSTAENDTTANGFYARELADERKCSTMEANQLVDITSVTDRIKRATEGKDDAAFAAALKAEKAKIESECAGKDDSVRCEVVELYRGGIYDLYKYRRFQDVRLVFAPEASIAFFGGDPDNFEFPRYNFDVSFLRVYVDGKPLDTSASYLRYAKADARAGDVVFTSGNPGSTDRLETVAQLQYRRDVVLPRFIAWDSELRGQLTQFVRESSEHSRIAQAVLYNEENWLKGEKGQFAALLDPTIIHDHMVAEQALRAKVNADPALRSQFGTAWDDIRGTIERYRPQSDRFFLLGSERMGFQSQLMDYAVILVRHAAEAAKPDAERLAGYTEASFPALRQQALSTEPFYPDLEKLKLTFSLTKVRELLGADDDFVRKAFGRKSPAELAAELIDGTRLGDLALRKRLIDADLATIKASDDPMIKFMLAIDPDLRAARQEQEDGFNASLSRYGAKIAQARFEVEGASSYPDATHTLRLSYGAVAGYSVGGRQIAPMTNVGGLYARATGSEPFRLPPSWIAAQASLDPNQPFNLATTNDIVGGNSGSPLVNKDGEVVGAAFDSNIQALGGDFGYDPAVNRTVAVAVGLLREGLAKVYHADRLVKELAE